MTWNGLVPQKIYMHGFSSSLPSYNQDWIGTFPIENDKYIITSGETNKEEFFQAACNGKIQVVTDASYISNSSTREAAAAWYMETI